uniref:Uncharacterized protein n=1 Tax=Pelagomonas calceolata TaxID=35677 RepID=A0A7S3ZWV3_9STRA|mmetsp:Transcript_1529/g.4211  ORF Transcript_1529/g.4211 Transcript_1529/m.4211 type:complete len:302 (+) Transcript_1529:108-1013(+)
MRYYALLAVMHAANVDGVGDLRRYRRRGAWHRRERASNATAQDASRRGVILWAHGRSATDTFCEAMRQAAHLTYCRNIKEGFNHLHAEGKRLTRNRLKKCVRRGQLLSHIKPGHLYSQGLATPEALFRAAREVGFGVVVAEYRQNALARMVSSFEMRTRTPADAKAVFCKKDGELVKKFEWERTIWERGVAAAKAEEFTIIEFTFLELISSVCTCVERATSVLADCAGARCECRDQVKENVHMRTSHRDRTLAERTSPTAANCIRAALRVDPQYAWMLDLSRHEPPEGVSNANASWLVGSS